MPKKDIVSVYNFATEEECNLIIEYQKYLTENNLWTKSSLEVDPKQHWSKRYLGAKALKSKSDGFGSEHDIKIYNLLIDLRKKVKKTIMDSWNLNEEIYSDSLNLIRWPNGEYQPAHADFENFGLQPHVYNWRDIGVVIYMNNDFEGGEISFPQYDYDIKIEPGMLAFFPGDMHHAHRVKPVSNGCRYTVNMFFTFDKRFWDGDN